MEDWLWLLLLFGVVGSDQSLVAAESDFLGCCWLFVLLSTYWVEIRTLKHARCCHSFKLQKNRLGLSVGIDKSLASFLKCLGPIQDF